MFLYTPDRIFLRTEYKYNSEEPLRSPSRLSDSGSELVDGASDLNISRTGSAPDSAHKTHQQFESAANKDPWAPKCSTFKAELTEFYQRPSKEKGKQKAGGSPELSHGPFETGFNGFEDIEHSQSEYIDGLTSYYNGGVFTCSASVSTSPKSELYDLIDFLAIAQHRRIDIIPFRWDKESDIGMGGTARISQSVTAETSLGHKLCLAFKRFQREGSRYEADRNKIFQALISEVYILGHPVVQQHPNINSLKGIAWDNVYDEVWPVLVFKKTEYGDLKHFMTTDEGKALDFSTKARLCYEIGNAVNLMHTCYAIHGDLKPNNILIFKNNDDEFSAKVTDFGYSTIFAQEQTDVRITLPQSWPWTAPEIEENPTVTFEQAKAADLFSYGLLCYWLLFYDELRDKASSEPDYDPRLKELQLIDKLKKNENLCKLVEDDLIEFLPTIRKSHIPRELFELEFLFVSCFSRDSCQRRMEINTLPSVFNFTGKTLPLIEEYGKFALLRSEAKFSLVAMVLQFRFCPTETKKAIFHCIETRTKSLDKKIREQAAYELALCYQQGFGVLRDQEKCNIWLDKADQPPEALEFLIDMLESDPGTFYSFNNTKITFIDSKHLTKDPGTSGMQPGGYYEHELFSAATSAWIHKELEIEVQEIRVLRHPDPSSEAAKMELEEHVNSLKVALGCQDDSPTGVSTMTIPLKPEFHSSMSRFKRLPLLSGLQATSPDDNFELRKYNVVKKAAVLGPDHQLVIQDMKGLFLHCLERKHYGNAEFFALFTVYMERGVYGMENPVTLNTIEKLYGVYIELKQWNTAETLLVQIVNARIKVLGIKHKDTIRTFRYMEDLIDGYINTNQRERAIKVLEKLVDMKQQAYGVEDLKTLSTTEYLAVEYIIDGSVERLELAEGLLFRLIQGTTKVFGKSSIAVTDSQQILAGVNVLLMEKVPDGRNRNPTIRQLQMIVDRAMAKEDQSHKPSADPGDNSEIGDHRDSSDPRWGSEGSSRSKYLVTPMRELVWERLNATMVMTPFDESIKAHERKVDEAEDLSALRITAITSLSILHVARCLFTEQVDDADIALSWRQLELSMMPEDTPERRLLLHKIASCYGLRYSLTKSPTDLDKLISITEEAISAATGEDEISEWLSGLADALRERHKISGNIDDLTAAVVWYEQATAIAPSEAQINSGEVAAAKASRGLLTYQTATLYEELFESSGYKDIDALNSAISAYEISKQTDCGEYLDYRKRRMQDADIQIQLGSTIAKLYRHRYDLLGNIEDIDNAIRIVNESAWIAREREPELTPEYRIYSNQPYLLLIGDLAEYHLWRYKDSESLRDLETATEYIERAAKSVFLDSAARPWIDSIQSEIRIANYRVSRGKPGWKVVHSNL
ncbi:hypothetical protein TWF730_007967 [Orbilia blumenaviensis]|uniref:Protein kinase domain-containing protein n=1 Tax=Orbilia blumenaviensis TaxID=1796055 RepID=A0AAV9V9X4_9PEZI